MSQIIPHLHNINFGLWIKKQDSQYVISKNNEKEILMLLTYLPMSQQMNNILYAKYLDQILSK